MYRFLGQCRGNRNIHGKVGTFLRTHGSMYVCMDAWAKAQNGLVERGHSPFPRCRARKSKHTRKNRRSVKRHGSVYVCIDGHFPSACVGRIDIQTYTHDVSHFTFYVFLTFSPKNAALATEIEISGFPKKTLFFHVGCTFPRQAWANLHRILVLRWCKNRIDELKACMCVCLYVCLFSRISFHVYHFMYIISCISFHAYYLIATRIPPDPFCGTEAWRVCQIRISESWRCYGSTLFARNN